MTTQVPPLQVYVAVLDGDSPADWKPFQAPLKDIALSVGSYVAPPVDSHNPGGAVGYLMRSIKDIEEDETVPIVGVLIDGSNLNAPLKPTIEVRQDELRILCRQLQKQKNALYRHFGFRLWLVCKKDNPIEDTRIIVKLKEPVATSLRLDIKEVQFDQILVEDVLEHMARSLAMEVAIRASFSTDS